MNELIRIDNVTKRYGEKCALDGINLSIPQGRIFGLLGPNGAGKTTLIRIMNRILIPSAGTVWFQGHPISEEDVRRIGYLPEERGLYRKMKVGEQAMYFARLKGMSRADARAAVMEWFTRFGIEGWWNKKVEELSKGMAQKVQFITTVVHKPGLIILDEPFSGFDPVNTAIVRSEIMALKQTGATIILSTHNMESVEEMCDEIALIDKSRLVVTGAVDEVRRRYGDNAVELVYEDATGHHGEYRKMSSGSDVNSVVRECLDRGVRLISVREILPGMNDIFIKLVTGGEGK